MRVDSTEYPFHEAIDRAAKYSHLSYRERLGLLVEEIEIETNLDVTINKEGEGIYGID